MLHPAEDFEILLQSQVNIYAIMQGQLQLFASLDKGCEEQCKVAVRGVKDAKLDCEQANCDTVDRVGM